MTRDAERSGFGVLIAAHGERGGAANNQGLMQLAADLARRDIADQIEIGMIKGTPSIGDAVRAMTVGRICIYPLFLSDGYFTRVRLPALLAEATQATGIALPHLIWLPPLGLDPGLAAIVVARARQATIAQDQSASKITLVLCAHGSSNDPSSRQATARLRDAIDRAQVFQAVRIALLEEPPSLAETMAATPGPAIVVGLFAGDGLHGGGDVPRLLTGLQRSDVNFAGNVGAWPEIADLVAASVRRVPVMG